MELFPNLSKDNFEVTSDCDGRYNCIAWAAGTNGSWWWPFPIPLPGSTWPAGVPRTATVESFRLAFASLGYQECEDGEPCENAEKIAIFADAAGTPTHAAYMPAGGRWKSKLGTAWDIEHDAAEDVGGSSYGETRLFMQRGDPLQRDPGVH
ncbi:MAG: uncharacterized protein JWN65_4090 [Solirubrobacterales bacterium]|nr:uncharacterized protein [Solirubrobacterales bacterium]